MIGRLRGILLEKDPPLILLEVGGIGYEIYMPMVCFCKLPDIGEEAIIFIHFVAREDANLLFGFNNKQEKIIFQSLIKTNGIGPKLALKILSKMSFQQFINAIEQEDSFKLVKLPGVGKKTAERLIIEMKDRFKDFFCKNYSSTHNLKFASSDSIPVINSIEKEAIDALIALGYKPKEASNMINKIIKKDISSKTLIYEALRTAL